jgi:hypothetical protein
MIVKAYSVTDLAIKDASRRYSPSEVIAVEREILSGVPAQILTSFERQNLTLRMTQRRLARRTNGFSKKLNNHAAAVGQYVAHYKPLPRSRRAADHAGRCPWRCGPDWTIGGFHGRHVGGRAEPACPRAISR